MTLNPLVAGEDLTAGRLNALYDENRTVYQSSDQTVNNSTTLVSSTSLTVTVAANSTYIFDAWLHWESNPTADFKFILSVPAGATGRWSPICPTDASAPIVGAERINYTVFQTEALTVSWSGAGDDTTTGTIFICARPSGYIVTAGNSGSATIQFAQNVANVSNTRLKTGSWMRLTKVG